MRAAYTTHLATVCRDCGTLQTTKANPDNYSDRVSGLAALKRLGLVMTTGWGLGARWELTGR